jgi:hypothetical protein
MLRLVGLGLRAGRVEAAPARSEFLRLPGTPRRNRGHLGSCLSSLRLQGTPVAMASLRR